LSTSSDTTTKINSSLTATVSSSSTIREYTLSLNSFSRPLVLTDADATCVKLMELILLEKGTYPTRPDMGVGLVSRYRYSLTDNLNQLESDISDQIDTYLPELEATEVNVTEQNRIINISITVDEVVYNLTYNKDTNSLDSL
jgi:hypothetical protein